MRACRWFGITKWTARSFLRVIIKVAEDLHSSHRWLSHSISWNIFKYSAPWLGR